MKLLLDEQIDVRLKTALIELEVYTLVDMGWQGVKNGVLSGKINENGFAFFITADKNLPFQQNLDKLLFTLILLDTPTLLREHQSLFAPKINAYVTGVASTSLPKIVHICSRQSMGEPILHRNNPTVRISRCTTQLTTQ